jgi:hypothetical protein
MLILVPAMATAAFVSDGNDDDVAVFSTRVLLSADGVVMMLTMV